mmetsp:Transcript_154072/g.492684  ORF Transcript_154072/g.492684 Transcript_154072/m.492684 type:complete len:164 (-) Transcript_154072:1325-1816(-)
MALGSTCGGASGTPELDAAAPGAPDDDDGRRLGPEAVEKERFGAAMPAELGRGCATVALRPDEAAPLADLGPNFATGGLGPDGAAASAELGPVCATGALSSDEAAAPADLGRDCASAVLRPDEAAATGMLRRLTAEAIGAVIGAVRLEAALAELGRDRLHAAT